MGVMIWESSLVVLGVVLFAWHFSQRKRFISRLLGFLLLAVALILAMFLALPIIPKSVWLPILRGHSIAIIALCVAGVCFCWDASIADGLFCATGGYALQNLYAQANIQLYYQFGMGLSGQIIAFSLVYAAGYFLWIRRLKNGSAKPALRAVGGGLASVIVVCILLPSEIYKYDLGDLYQPINIIVSGIQAIFCAAIIEVQLDAIEKKQTVEDNQRLSWLLREKGQEYENIKSAMELLNIKSHDLKRFLSNQVTDSKLEHEMKEDLSKVIEFYDAQYNTGCQALDVVLCEKAMRCFREGIIFECMADGEKLNFMKPVDVYTLFENALGNAVEASLNCPEGERIISMVMSAKGSFIRIRIENHCMTVPQIKNGMPVTTKADKENHGFGVASIKMIVEKYGGKLNIGTEDTLFVVNLLLPGVQETAM